MNGPVAECVESEEPGLESTLHLGVTLGKAPGLLGPPCLQVLRRAVRLKQQEVWTVWSRGGAGKERCRGSKGRQLPYLGLC